ELMDVDGAKREAIATQDAVTGPEGTAIALFKNVKPGTYVIRAQAVQGQEKIGLAEEPVIVEAADVEYQAPFPRPDILKALADASGGHYLDLSERMPALEIKDTRRVEVDRTKRIPIWDTFPAFIGLLLLAGCEWWLRRRAGLL